VAGCEIPDSSLGGCVVLLDGHGERLRADPIAIKEGKVTSVAFGPNDTVAAGYAHRDDRGNILDGGVALLDVSPASWKAKLAGIVNRNFTWAEWRHFFPDADTPYRRTIRSCPWPHDLPEDERQKAEDWEKSH
jgi:hypothetical protein